MGGQSSGNFSVVEQGSESYGLFQGTVRNVSFLHAPGFCRFTTVFPGGKHENAAEFLEGGLKITLRHRHAGGHGGGHGGRGEEYQGFKVAVSSPGASHHHGGHELFGMYKVRLFFLPGVAVVCLRVDAAPLAKCAKVSLCKSV